MLLLLLFLVSFALIHARSPPSLQPNALSLATLNVRENDPIELQCPVNAAPDLSVQWSKNNEELDSMWSTSNLSIRRFQLKIARAQSTDAGLYKCSAVNGFGSVHAQFRVTVQSNGTTSDSVIPNDVIAWDVDTLGGEAPEFLSRTDTAHTGPTKVIQPEGTTVQFKCLASGKPTPDIRWKKNGKILSEDEYGVTQSQILNIKDLRATDTGNYTCELFNSFGTINATYILIVTEQLQFYGNDPQNTTVEAGKTAVLHCRVRTNDRSTKIQWLKKLDMQEIFRPDAIVFGSEQYEIIEQTSKQHLTDTENVLSKPLMFASTHVKHRGQYICLIQNEKITDYKKAFLNVMDTNAGAITSTSINNNLLYILLVPLLMLGCLLAAIGWVRHRHQQRHHHHHARGTDSLRASAKPRLPLMQHSGPLLPSTTSGTSNDYLTNSVDSIPVTRQYQAQRYGPSISSDLASLTSSNLYYTRVQGL